MRAFVDTMILKWARKARQRLRPLRREYFGNADRPMSVDLFELYTPGTTDRLMGEVRREADLLPRIAELAATGKLELLCNIEVTVEYMQLRDSTGGGPHFFGAPITWSEAPLVYSRSITGPVTDAGKPQSDWGQS